VNTDELGNLGLTKKEEALIVAFMETLSDGYKPKKSDLGSPIVELPGVAVTPNPFNPTTRISYTVPREGLVDVAIYDVAGRRVQVLAAGWRSAGEYTVTFTGDRMASGVYFVRFATAGHVSTTRAILLK